MVGLRTSRLRAGRVSGDSRLIHVDRLAVRVDSPCGGWKVYVSPKHACCAAVVVGLAAGRAYVPLSGAGRYSFSTAAGLTGLCSC